MKHVVRFGIFSLIVCWLVSSLLVTFAHGLPRLGIDGIGNVSTKYFLIPLVLCLFVWGLLYFSYKDVEVKNKYLSLLGTIYEPGKGFKRFILSLIASTVYTFLFMEIFRFLNVQSLIGGYTVTWYTVPTSSLLITIMDMIRIENENDNYVWRDMH